MTTSGKAQKADLVEKNNKSRSELWKRIISVRRLYLLLLPTFALILVFSYAPILMGFYYSFTRYDGMHAFWIGLENYRRIFQDPALVHWQRDSHQK